jgi:excisionase family DNA binding protein
MKPIKSDCIEKRDRLPTHQDPVQGNLFEPLLDSTEAANLLKIHPKTLQKMARKGEIAAIQIGKLWRFRASALNEWLEKIAS